MPKLLKTPFAIDAAEGFRTDIQESTGAAPNSATYQVGFPPVTMQSIASNGMPPKGSDLNGVLYDITDNLVFLTQGGVYGFDAAYATSIGGYPLNARLRLTNGDIVKSTIDGNTNDPNVDMTGWVKTNSASQIFDESGLSQQDINNKQKERDKDEINARDWGVLPTNSPEVNSANWFALNNAFPERPALDIFVPVGTYNFSDGFYITRPHNITGVSVGELCKTIFDFDGADPVGTANYKSGIFIIHPRCADDTSGNGATLPVGQVGKNGTGARINDILVKNSPEHGIIKNAPSYLKGVGAQNNTKHGILTVGTCNLPTYGVIKGIANQGTNVECCAIYNGWSGIIEIGDDANAVKNDSCLAAYNGQFGFFDGSLLGGVNINGQGHINTLGDYVMQGTLYDTVTGLGVTPSRQVYIGCYSEGSRDEGYSTTSRAIILGATGSIPRSHNTSVILPSVAGIQTRQSFMVVDDAQTVVDGKGADFSQIKKGGLKFGFSNLPDDNVEFGQFGQTDRIEWRLNATTAGRFITFFLKDFSSTLKAGRAWFPNGFALGSAHSQTAATSAPTSGTYQRGNIVWNESPTAGSKIGWVCVTGGSPGVWKPFGVIDS